MVLVTITSTRKFYNFNELEKTYEYITANKHVCKCGHSLFVEGEKILCDHCGHYVFKDKQTEFKYRMKEKLIKSKRH